MNPIVIQVILVYKAGVCLKVVKLHVFFADQHVHDLLFLGEPSFKISVSRLVGPIEQGVGRKKHGKSRLPVRAYIGKQVFLTAHLRKIHQPCGQGLLSLIHIYSSARRSTHSVTSRHSEELPML